MTKRIVNLLVSIILVLTYSILDCTGANALSVNDSSVFLKQQTNYTCTLTSAAMMLRRRAIIDGGDWASITESSLRGTAWDENAGLKSGFTFAGMSVSRAYFSNPTNPASELISLLANHPEGIEVYNNQHAILVTDYDSTTGTFYCADPWPTVSSGRIPMSSSALSGSGQQSKLTKLVKYWYISNRSGGGSNPENVPPTLSSPDQNATFSVHTNITFTWSNVGSRYHFIITSPSGSTGDIFTSATSCNYSPNIAGTWKWKVRYESDTGKTGPWSQERTFTVTDNSTPQPASETYSVQYYKDVGCGSIGGSVSSESELTSINKNWGTGDSPGGCTSNQFSAVFNGNIYFTAGWYRFNYTVDDSIKLWLTKDGAIDCICDNNGQKDSPQSGGRYYNITSAGTYTVRVEYIKCHTGTGVVQVAWTPVAPPMLHVYFDSMGGSPVATATVLCDSRVAQPTNPVKTGYTFGGWYRQRECTEAFQFASNTINGDTTLYARWELNHYTVGFDSQGGSAVGNLSVPYHSTFAKPYNPVRRGYVFVGWYTDYSYQYAWNFASDFVVADIVLFAKWTASKYAITAAPNNTAWGTVSGGGSIAYGTSATVKATPKVGYRFVRWLEGSTTVSTSYQYSFTVTKARTLKAEFAKIASPTVTAASAGYTSIRLTWAAVAGAQGYEVSRYNPATKQYKVLATVSTTNYTNTGLTAGTVYAYKVRAKCVAGSTTTYGGFSAIASAKPIPARPVGVKAVRASASSITVRWNAVAGANGYEVYRATAAGGNYTPMKSTTTLNWTNTGLTTGRTYYYKVRAYRVVGGTKIYSSYSDIVYRKP